MRWPTLVGHTASAIRPFLGSNRPTHGTLSSNVSHSYALKNTHMTARREGRRDLKSLVRKRSITIAGRRTSVALEDDFWNCLRDIAEQRQETLPHLVASIDTDRQPNLSSAIRLFVLDFYRAQYEAGAALDTSIRQSPGVSHSTISRL